MYCWYDVEYYNNLFEVNQYIKIRAKNKKEVPKEFYKHRREDICNIIKIDLSLRQ